MTQPADTRPPWPDLIAAMGQLREQVSQVDEDFEFTIPHLAATQEQLAAAEQRLGHALDPQHKEFLSYGNGWPEFYMGNALLGTEELGQGMAWAEVTETLDAFYSALEDPSLVPPRAQIYPFSFDPGAATVFAIWKDGPVTDGGHPVLWLPAVDTEPYENFFDFFRMVYQEYEDELPES
jgi:hypothetical protein